MNGNGLSRFLLSILLATGLISAPLQAQQTNADASFVAPTVPRVAAPSTDTVIEKPAPYDITGIVAQAFKMKKPLRIISPTAPAKEGDGKENVSWDPDKPGKPKGIILFGIQW